MSRKKGESEKANVPKPQPEKPKEAAAPEFEQAKPHDYGGLPQRDLKKNLGCG
ncbi:hypothetical protein [Ohtaekwangia sp.]|uniref:hypothetical protein n=1 Tax=Ohtaekwangia sp. TaxID=2066019 RepID=UPI002F923991